MFSSRRKAALVAAAAGLVLLAPVEAGLAAEPTGASAQDSAIYTVPNTDSASRTEINRSGAEVLGVTKDRVASVEATGAEAD